MVSDVFKTHTTLECLFANVHKDKATEGAGNSVLITQLAAVLRMFQPPQLLSLGLLEDLSPPLAVGVQELVLPIFQSVEQI